jgi:hypothetical protein
MGVLPGDDRYTVRKEFTGEYHAHPGLMLGQMWVVRFCGEFVAAVQDKPAGMQVVAAHQSGMRERMLAAVDAQWDAAIAHTSGLT